MSSILASRYVLRCLYAHHHNVREPTATRRGQAKQKQSKASDMPYPKPGPGVHQVWRIRIKCIIELKKIIILSASSAQHMGPGGPCQRACLQAASSIVFALVPHSWMRQATPRSTYDGPMARPRSTHGNNQWSPVHRQLRACLHASLHCAHADHACCC